MPAVGGLSGALPLTARPRRSASRQIDIGPGPPEGRAAPYM